MKKSIFRWGFVLAMLVGLMTIAASAAAPEKTVCNGHPTEGDVVWTQVTEASQLTTDGGHFVLMNDIDLGTSGWGSLGADTTLCLNGHTLSNSSTSYVIRPGENITFTLCDCHGGGKVVANASITSNGIIYSTKNNTVKLEGGTICFADGFTGRGVRRTVAGKTVFNGGSMSNVTQGFYTVNQDVIEIYEGSTLQADNIFRRSSGNIAYKDNFTIAGGTFKCGQLTADEIKNFLPNDMPLSVLGETGNFTVKQGFYRDGSKQDFSTKLQFRLYLKCDNDIFSSIDNGTSAESLGWSVERSKGAGTMYSSGSQFVLIVGALTAKDIGTPVTCTVKDADGTVLFEETISAADVAKEIYDGTADEAVKTLMEDLVNYGNAAAEAFGGTTVNALGKGTTMLTQDWTRGENDYGVTNGDHDMYATLSLKNTIELNIYHKDAEGDVTYQTLSDIAIANALTSRDVTFGDGCCSVKYSIKDYILDVLNGEDNGQQALISALQKYIDSVCAVCAEA